MFSGKISEVMAGQIEKKVAEGGLSNLTDSELSQLAIEFVGDAPPSHVPRETVIEILSQQRDITNWREQIKQKATTTKGEQSERREKAKQLSGQSRPRTKLSIPPICIHPFSKS